MIEKEPPIGRCSWGVDWVVAHTVPVDKLDNSIILIILTYSHYKVENNSDCVQGKVIPREIPVYGDKGRK